MPAQIWITRAQIAQMAELGEDVIVTEATPQAGTLDIWVLDHETLNSQNHRSVVLDPEGRVLGDKTIED